MASGRSIEEIAALGAVDQDKLPMDIVDIHFRIKEINDENYATFLELLSHINISRLEITIIKRVFTNVKERTPNLAKDYILSNKYLDEVRRRFNLII